MYTKRWLAVKVVFLTHVYVQIHSENMHHKAQVGQKQVKIKLSKEQHTHTDANYTTILMQANLKVCENLTFFNNKKTLLLLFSQ